MFGSTEAFRRSVSSSEVHVWQFQQGVWAAAQSLAKLWNAGESLSKLLDSYASVN